MRRFIVSGSNIGYGTLSVWFPIFLPITVELCLEVDGRDVRKGGSAYNRSHSNTYRGKIIFLFGAEKSSGFSHPSGVLVHVLWRLGFFECRAILFKKSRAYFELLLIHYSAWHKEVYLHVVLKIETNLSVLNNLETYSKYRISTVWK